MRQDHKRAQFRTTPSEFIPNVSLESGDARKSKYELFHACYCIHTHGKMHFYFSKNNLSAIMGKSVKKKFTAVNGLISGEALKRTLEENYSNS